VEIEMMEIVIEKDNFKNDDIAIFDGQERGKDEYFCELSCQNARFETITRYVIATPQRRSRKDVNMGSVQA
jgi:hypothetical protein